MSYKMGLLAVFSLVTFSYCYKPIKNNENDKEGASEFRVYLDNPVSKNFLGFGTQYNQNLYAGISAAYGITASNVAQLEQKVKVLGSKYVRIFFDSKSWPSDPKYSTATADYMESFIKTVQLAQEAGASTINITYWHTSRPEKMADFADVLKELIVNRNLTAVNQVTIQNEVNGTSIAMTDYRACYVALDQSLKTLGIRNKIKFCGGDLIGNNQQAWFDYMANAMGTLVDGYSSHMYWDDNQKDKPITRLKEVTVILKGLGNPKPIYITEYGVRGGSQQCSEDPGCLTGSTTPISETTVSPLQNALFQINGLNLGYGGFIRWDCYRAKYDNGTQHYSGIGTANDGYPLYPLYYMTYLFANTAVPGWNVVQTDQGTYKEKAVAVLKSPAGDGLTVLAINTSSGTLPYAVGGLPADKTFKVIAWNADQTGKLTKSDNVSTDKEGVLKFSVSGGSVVSITTLDLDISAVQALR